MGYYYTLLQSKSHAFLLERRMKAGSVRCELTYMPREIMTDLCNLGIRFEERELGKAAELLRNCGIPGWKLFKEVVYDTGSQYVEIRL